MWMMNARIIAKKNSRVEITKIKAKSGDAVNIVAISFGLEKSSAKFTFYLRC
jgi:hypothetical protein